jgi:hypothetical protein
MSLPAAQREAARYSLLGMSVVPIKLDTKRPALRWGDRPAEPPTADELRDWFGRWPNAGVGCIIGDHFAVVDVDEHGTSGLDSLAELEAVHGPLPRTWREITPSGGLHIWFGLADGQRVSTRELAPGVQLRTGRHVLVMPPAIGREWELDPDEADLAPLPDWLAVAAGERTPAIGPGERIGEGHRHPTMVRLAGAMRRVGADEQTIRAALDTLNGRCDPAKDVADIEAIAADITQRYAPEPGETPVPEGESTPTPSVAEDEDTEGVKVLRALLGAFVVDVDAVTLDPLEPLPGAPFLLPGKSALLPGPEGCGKSQVAQIICLEVALAGGRALYVAGEVTHREFQTRAREILSARYADIRSNHRAAWRDRVIYADTGDLLPAIWRHHEAWATVCRDFTLIVVDAVSDAGAALGLDFSRDTDHWLQFFQTFARPCQDNAALLLLDNLAHDPEARSRAVGVAAKGHKIDIKLSSRARETPLSLIIRCEKARPIAAPFKKGDKWIAYEAGAQAPTILDPKQLALEREDDQAPDPAAVVVAALEEQAPQGIKRLETALREAGVRGEKDALRGLVRAMAEDLNCPVIDVGKRGFSLLTAGVAEGVAEGGGGVAYTETPPAPGAPPSDATVMTSDLDARLGDHPPEAFTEANRKRRESGPPARDDDERERRDLA